jgi:hypothetical protein
MKKIVLLVVGLLTFSVGVGFAAPINDLTAGQSAAGVMLNHDQNSFYVENKVTDTLTAGYEKVNLNDVGMDDFYTQFDMNKGAKLLLGFRDLPSDSDAYAGLALSSVLSPECTAYGTFKAGKDFTEAQLGANYKLSDQYALNLNYRAFNNHGFSYVTTVGASVMF